MKYTLIALCTLLLLSACQPAAPQETINETGVHLQSVFNIPEELEGQPTTHDHMDYLLYLPEEYYEEPEREWPLIVFLHGSGNNESTSEFVIGQGLPAVLYTNEEPEEFPFIVVSPQSFPNVPWWELDSLAVVNALLDEVIETYRVDSSRVYLTGLSMGGYGTWFLASQYPEKFAAASSISGSGFRSAMLPSEEVLCQISEVPTWAIHGEGDNISAPDAFKMIVTVVDSACGDDFKWTMYPDTNHFTTYARAYRDPALYEWFLEHQKSQ